MTSKQQTVLIEEAELKESERYSALSCVICHKEAMIHTASDFVLRQLGVQAIVFCKECGNTIRHNLLGPDVPKSPALLRQMALLKEIHREYTILKEQGRPTSRQETMHLIMRIEILAAVMDALNMEFSDMAKDLGTRQGMPPGYTW